MRMNLENASRSWGRPRVQECGDACTHDDRDEEARQKSMYSASGLCDVHYDAVHSDRGQRWFSDLEKFQTKGVNCRLDETRAKGQ